MDVSNLTDLASRVGPVLVFLLAITVVAEIADRAGVFDVAAHWASRAGRQRTVVLWLLFALLSCVCTIVLSLDTTAVLLTPVGLAIARQLGISPLPFAFTTLWLANTASLLLPVSNLTNLLALHRFEELGVGHGGYVRAAAVPALTIIAATLLVIAALHWRSLLGRYAVEAAPEVHDPVLLKVAGAVCVLLGPLFALGVQPAIASTAAAAVLAAVAWVRDRPGLRTVAVPWRMALAVAALFLVVDFAVENGLRDGLTALVGSGATPASLAQVIGVGAGAANLVNNLPAYLALESVTGDDPTRLVALLIGVNAGPLLTPWASLATLLWLQRCRSAGVRISPVTVSWQGGVCAVAACAAGWAALAFL